MGRTNSCNFSKNRVYHKFTRADKILEVHVKPADGSPKDITVNIGDCDCCLVIFHVYQLIMSQS